MPSLCKFDIASAFWWQAKLELYIILVILKSKIAWWTRSYSEFPLKLSVIFSKWFLLVPNTRGKFFLEWFQTIHQNEFWSYSKKFLQNTYLFSKTLSNWSTLNVKQQLSIDCIIDALGRPATIVHRTLIQQKKYNTILFFLFSAG